MKAGFPPKEAGASDSDLLVSAGLRSGDLVVAEVSSAPAQTVPIATALVRRVMKDDNSCLFNSICYVLKPKIPNLTADSLRKS